jgi:probable F420-dependent oxidoreductase
MSGGRFRLGLGTQIRAHVERRYSQPWYGVTGALRDYVACCRHIWHSWQTQTREPYEGRYYQFTLSNPEFEPEPLPAQDAPVPVWLAAVGPKMAELAGEIADGVHVHAFTSEPYLRQHFWPTVEAGARSAGRDPAALQASCPVLAGVAHDDEERAHLLALFRRQVAFYGSTPAYRGVLDSIGASDLHARLHELSREQRWQEMDALVSDETVEELALIDEPLPLAHKLRQRYGGILTQLSLYRGADCFMREDEWPLLIEALGAEVPMSAEARAVHR